MEHLPALLNGALVTIWVSLSGIILGVPLGLVLALIRWGDVPLLSPLIAFYVSVVRATPAVTMALLIYFAMPNLGINVGPVAAAVLTLTVNTSAFNSEIWRAALIDFPRDELEAARSFGMSRSLAFRRIIFPQAWRHSLPVLVNEMTLLIKASPAIAVVGIVDLTRAAGRIGAETYDPLPPFIVATLIYATFVLVFVLAQRQVERFVARRYGLA